MTAQAPTGGDPGERPDAPTAEMPPLGSTPPAAESDAFAERPQVFLGAAFAGGLVAAQLLKRLRR